MSETTRKPPVGRIVVKCKESGERSEIGCLWENRFSNSGNYDVSFYKNDESRPEGQMDRMSLQTFAERGGPEQFYVSHWQTGGGPKKRDESDVPF